MRWFAWLTLCSVLVACGDVKSDVPNVKPASDTDQRYALSLYGTPKMTYSTAKSCYQLMKLGEAEIKKTPGVMGKVFGEHMKPYWRMLVDIGSEGEASKKDLLVAGKFVKSNEEPSFALTGSMVERSEQCGFITGQAFIKSGFLNIGDMIGADDDNKEVEFDSDEVLGMYILGQATEDVFANKRPMIVDCAAAMVTALPQDSEPDASSVVWMSALADFISEGDGSVSSLADSSDNFKRLVDGKGDLSLPKEKLDRDLLASCTEIANAAVVKAQAEVQK